MTALRKSVHPRMTVAEFLDWADRDPSGRRWQLRDGVPEAMAPTTEPHGAILAELGALIRNHLLDLAAPAGQWWSPVSSRGPGPMRTYAFRTSPWFAARRAASG